MNVDSTPERAVKGVKGSAPRFRRAREELPELSRVYIEERSAKMALQRRAAEIDLAEREGSLISRRRAKIQLGFLLTGLRQRLLSFVYALPRELAGKNEHECGRILDAEVRAALRDIATWPERMADPAWVEQIDADLMPTEGNGSGPKALGALEAAERRKVAVARENAQQRAKRKARR
jgi:hypothetical protein